MRKLITAENILLAIAVIVGIFGIFMLHSYDKKLDEIAAEVAKRPLIELPEEYKAITPNDNLMGYYDSKGVLHIQFNNQRNK